MASVDCEPTSASRASALDRRPSLTKTRRRRQQSVDHQSEELPPTKLRHSKRRQPDSRINSYLIGKNARAAISTAITFLSCVAHQKAPRSVEVPNSRSLAFG